MTEAYFSRPGIFGLGKMLMAASATERRATVDAAAPGSGDATAAGGELGGPDHGGGQGALQDALQGATEQAVAEPLPGGPTDPAPASPAPSSPHTPPLTPLPPLALSPLASP
ncbi:uncharacterized protein N7487_008889 [Penicillium crustosum]|uniref:uncharacterized protein n=1 Tax=Penicillium crustosum TaxID=36656 RepID=UPI002384E627|nr:uncharacterized protein N7487_008889 [Penicillium crustosum]KAJ5402993.1 hypothetical protein N7487_008889 [Penicillium crustosum]